MYMSANAKPRQHWIMANYCDLLRHSLSCIKFYEVVNIKLLSILIIITLCLKFGIVNSEKLHILKNFVGLNVSLPS